MKVWLACTLAFLAALLVSVYVPALPQSVIMFGFMAMVFTMRERVESSAEMVRRVRHYLVPPRRQQAWGLASVWANVLVMHRQHESGGNRSHTMD